MIEKFNYLYESLKGAGLRPIKSLAVRTENYNKAIYTLKKRFGKVDVVRENHIKHLISGLKIV